MPFGVESIYVLIQPHHSSHLSKQMFFFVITAPKPRFDYIDQSDQKRHGFCFDSFFCFSITLVLLLMPLVSFRLPPSSCFFLQLTRQSSVAYLASFLARGSFVDASLVSSAVQALLDWAARYLDEHVDGLTVTASTPQTATMSTPGSKVGGRQFVGVPPCIISSRGEGQSRHAVVRGAIYIYIQVYT